MTEKGRPQRKAVTTETSAADASASATIVQMEGRCECECAFCGARGFETDAAALGRVIAEGARSGSRRIVFTGAEPALHPEIAALVRMARKAGFRHVRLETCGLAAADAYKQLMKDGVTEIAILIPANDAPLYDRMTRTSGGFPKLQAAVRAIRSGRGGWMRLSARTPLCADNARSVRDIVAFVADAGIGEIVFTERFDADRGINAEEIIESALNAARERGLSAEARSGDSIVRVTGEAERREEALRLLYDPTWMYVGRRRVLLGVTLNVVYDCNLNCGFCTWDRSMPRPEAKAVATRLDRAIREKAPRLVLTGGEPTLHENLPEIIRRARSGGIQEVVIFTNAVRAADAGYARELAAAGLSSALVSLHAHEPALSDAMTGAPGAFGKTIAGIRNLLSTNVPVALSCVVQQANFTQLSDYVRYVSQNLPGTPVNLSFVTPLFPSVANRDFVPRYTDAAPRILDALDTCVELGVPVAGLEPHWGIPPCVLRADPRYFTCLLPARMRDVPPDFVKREDCSCCALDAECLGVRKAYAALHGLEELSPM